MDYNKGYRSLAATVIQIAVQDWDLVKEGEVLWLPEGDALEVNRAELLEFFHSTWFDVLAEVVGMNSEVMLDKLMANQYGKYN